MRFDIMTLFPDFVDGILSASVIGRARKAGFISVFCHNIRDYSEDKNRRVDDTPYGGGKGMLIAAPPVLRCFDHVISEGKEDETRHVIYLSPRGKVLTQKKAAELSHFDRLILLCGHYEGIDERAIERVADEEISIGDYVLTGGELPACILVDCVARMVDGVLADPDCYENESIASGMLEYPQYTRPLDLDGERVPEVLTSGNHEKIAEWRYRAALELTKKKRPDLL